MAKKPLHGRFLKDAEKVSTGKTWQWLKGGHLKKETEAMVCAAQEQALRVNSIKNHIDGQMYHQCISVVVVLS